MRLRHTGDVRLARAAYQRHPTNNLTYLFQKRSGWIQPYLTPTSRVVEVGCGAGFSTQFLRGPRFILTDYEVNPWIHIAADALRLPFRAASLDGILANNVVHHVAHPTEFFTEAHRALKVGGRLFIQEINCSPLMRVLLRVTHHEGYDFQCDVFNPQEICTNPRDLWDVNCAIPNLLFDDLERFQRHIPGWVIEQHRFDEVLIFPLSGGVIAKAPTISLPRLALRLIDGVDQVLIRLAPRLVALQRQIVLRAVVR